MKKRESRRWWLWALIILLVVGVGWWWRQQRFEVSLASSRQTVLPLQHFFWRVSNKLSAPQRWAKSFRQGYDSEQEIHQLQGRLAQIEADKVRLEEENRLLRESIGSEELPRWSLLPAWVVRQTDDGWWIAAGSDDGMEQGMLVLLNSHLIGRVERVEKQLSEVIDMRHGESRWEMVVYDNERSLVVSQGILGHDNEGLLLEGLLIDDAVAVGDMVLTKGGSGVLPMVPVGRVGWVGFSQASDLYQFARIDQEVDLNNVKMVEVLYRW